MRHFYLEINCRSQYRITRNKDRTILNIEVLKLVLILKDIGPRDKDRTVARTYEVQPLTRSRDFHIYLRIESYFKSESTLSQNLHQEKINTKLVQNKFRNKIVNLI